MIALDKGKVEVVKRELGIHDPVYIALLDDMTLVSQGKHTTGLYDEWHGGTHMIYVKKQPLSRSLSWNVAHELVHAKQAERHGSYARFLAEYVRQLRDCEASATHERMLSRSAYLRNYAKVPYEAEAECFAAMLDGGGVDLTRSYPLLYPPHLLRSCFID